MTTKPPTYTKEQLREAIAKLEAESEQLAKEWETASKSDRYWIEQSQDDIQSKRSRYYGYLKQFQEGGTSLRCGIMWTAIALIHPLTNLRHNP